MGALVVSVQTEPVSPPERSAVDTSRPASFSSKPASSGAALKPLDNLELESYRAVHPLAVGALLFGVISLLCFVDPWTFGLAAVLAVVMGLSALARIRKDADIYTGSQLARIGLTMGVICGLSSLTNDYISKYMRERSASQFARDYVEILKTGDLDQAVFYRLGAGSFRRNNDPKKAIANLKASAKGAGMDPYETLSGPIVQIQQALKTASKENLRFDAVETSAMDGTLPVVMVRLAIAGYDARANNNQGAKSERESYILLQLKAETKGGDYDWWVSDVVYPYTPRSAFFQATVDTHGHAH